MLKTKTYNHDECGNIKPITKRTKGNKHKTLLTKQLEKRLPLNFAG